MIKLTNIEEIITKYKNNIPIKNIKSEFGVSYKIIYKILKNNNIPLKGRGHGIKLLKVYPEEEIIKVYTEFNNIKKVSKLLHISFSKLKEILLKNNIELKQRNNIIRKEKLHFIENRDVLFHIPEQYKTFSGIYIIRNNIDKRVYIGSAMILYKRFNEHITDLCNNEHHSVYFQRFVNKYGLNSLSFELLSIVKEPLLLTTVEQYYLDLYKSYDKETGFNVLKNATSLNRLGITHRAETKNIISMKNKGHICTAETRKKISMANLGRLHTQKTIEKIIFSKQNISKEICEKISNSKITKCRVGQYDLNGNLINIYDNTKDAMLKTGFDRKSIHKNCKLKTITYKNYKWRFI